MVIARGGGMKASHGQKHIGGKAVQIDHLIREPFVVRIRRREPVNQLNHVSPRTQTQAIPIMTTSSNNAYSR